MSRAAGSRKVTTLSVKQFPPKIRIQAEGPQNQQKPRRGGKKDDQLGLDPFKRENK